MNKRLLLLLVTVLAAFPLYAHPHIMLLSDLDFIFSGRTCKGVWVEWAFDRFFSASIIQDYDTDHDGSFSIKEIKQVHDHAFINLKHYGFFVSFRKGKTRKSPDSVTNFSAREKDGELFYKFFIPLDTFKFSNGFYLSIFDPTYYCAVKYRKNPVKIEQSKGETPSFSIETNKNYPVYYNPYGAANDTSTYNKWKPGLQTAYPKEVHIFFKQ